MPLTNRALATAVVAALAAAPLSAQQPKGLVGDFLGNVSQVEQKVIGLARAMPADRYDWRPGEGVRSVGEVFLHIASNNWFLAGETGRHAPDATGIVAGDYGSVQRFETRSMTKDEIVAELERSFAFLKENLRASENDLEQTVAFFGQQAPVRAVWVATVTHMHEHLGQSIAYARMNGIVPPWSS